MGHALHKTGGWNWVSFNLEINEPGIENIFGNMMLIDGDLVSHAERFTAYSEATNSWLGSLNELEIGKLYRVLSAQGGELNYMGKVF